ncbi:MAG: hypothetical protein ACN6RG_06600 [Stenotrophomonas sp.]
MKKPGECRAFFLPGSTWNLISEQTFRKPFAVVAKDSHCSRSRTISSQRPRALRICRHPACFFPFLDLDFRRRDLPQAPGSSHGDPIPGSDGPGLEAIFGTTGDGAVLVARLMGIENAISPQKLGKRVVPLSLAGHGTADLASSAAVRPESEARRQQILDAASPSVRRLPLVSLTSAGIGPHDESRNGDMRGFGVPAWGEKAGRFHAAPSNPAQRRGISSNLNVRWRAGLPDFAI